MVLEITLLERAIVPACMIFLNSYLLVLLLLVFSILSLISSALRGLKFLMYYVLAMNFAGLGSYLSSLFSRGKAAIP